MNQRRSWPDETGYDDSVRASGEGALSRLDAASDQGAGRRPSGSEAAAECSALPDFRQVAAAPDSTIDSAKRRS